MRTQWSRLVCGAHDQPRHCRVCIRSCRAGLDMEPNMESYALTSSLRHIHLPLFRPRQSPPLNVLSLDELRNGDDSPSRWRYPYPSTPLLVCCPLICLSASFMSHCLSGIYTLRACYSLPELVRSQRLSEACSTTPTIKPFFWIDWFASILPTLYHDTHGTATLLSW